MRRLWILLAIVLSALAGYKGWTWGPALIDWLSVAALIGHADELVGASPYLRATIALSTAAMASVIFFVVPIALADWATTIRTLANLTRLGQPSEEDDKPSPISVEDFCSAFSVDKQLYSVAKDYSVCLEEVGPHRKSSANPSRLYATAPAATYFRSDRLVDVPLSVWFFRHLPSALFGLALIGLGLGLYDGLNRYRTWTSANDISGVTPTDGLLLGFEIGTAAFIVAMASAVVIRLVLHIVVAARRGQVDRLCRNIDAVFNDGEQTAFRRKLALLEADELRRMISRAMGEVKRSGDRVVDSVNSQSATSIAESVEKALAKPMDQMAQVAQRTAADQGKQVQELLHATLAAFIDTLQKRFGNAVDEINAILAASAGMAKDVHSSLAGMADTVAQTSAEQQERHHQELHALIAAEAEKHVKETQQFAVQIQDIAGTLSKHVSDHASQFEQALGKLLERVEDIARTSLSTGAQDLAKTASEFSGLHAMLESLVVSVTPSLNQVISTQERLRETLEDEAGAGKIIATAANDLGSAARVSRETVEKFILLARHLTETSKALSNVSADPSELGDSIAKSEKHLRSSKSGDELSRALLELREETEGKAKDLPDL